MSLVDYSPRGCKELDITERLTLSLNTASKVYVLKILLSTQKIKLNKVERCFTIC